MTKQKDTNKVLIVGAGPVGLFCAYMLAQSGIRVVLFEEQESLKDDPRAATTHPATLELLGDNGLIEDVCRAGLLAPVFQFWDKPSASLIAEFDHSVLSDETSFPFVVQCEQFKLSHILLERLASQDIVTIHFGAPVREVSLDSHSASVLFEGPDGIRTETGAYVIGADGGKSFVRKSLNIPFEGFTWPERFLVLTTPFDFESEIGCSYRSYFADPQQWCNCFKVAGDGPPGLWRTVFPVDLDQSEEELLSNAYIEDLLQSFHSSSTQFEIAHRNLYQVHQRVAQSFRKGRALLAGDAAHVNNPIGGMGLNGGLQDAANLSGKLIRILCEGAKDSLLDLYDAQRRTIALEYVQQQTIENKKRLEAREPAAREKYLSELRETAADPLRAKAFLMRTAMIESQRRAASIAL